MGRANTSSARRRLHDAAEVHDHDAVGEVAHHAEVVADEEIGEAELLAQADEQVQHLRLDRDVERGDRLVADQEARLHRERAGDADAAALPAGELVREAPREARVEADALHDLGDVGIALARLDEAVHHRRLADRCRRCACAD